MNPKICKEAIIPVMDSRKKIKSENTWIGLWLAPHFLLLISWTSPRPCVQQSNGDCKTVHWPLATTRGKIFMKINIPFNTYHASSQHIVYQKVLKLAPKLFKSWQMHWPLSKELGSNLCFMLVRGGNNIAGGRARGWRHSFQEENPKDQRS